jgi:hypothetical protein
MRIPIREQLALLVLTTTLVALAIISIATVNILHYCMNQRTKLIQHMQWENNYNLVVGIM